MVSQTAAAMQVKVKVFAGMIADVPVLYIV